VVFQSSWSTVALPTLFFGATWK